MDFIELFTKADVLTPVTLGIISLRLFVSLCLSSFIAGMYKITHKGVSYSYSLVIGIILISLVITMILMAIDNSVASAFGLFGALSIIRFRTPVKDIKDTVYLFLAIAVGIACGTGALKVAIFGTLFISFTSFILFFIKFGHKNEKSYIVKIFFNNQENQSEIVDIILKKYLEKLEMIELRSLGAQGIEMIYDVQIGDVNSLDRLVLELQAVKSVDQVFILSATHNLDLQ